MQFAKLAELQKLWPDMADHMENVAKLPDELSEEERNLLSCAFHNTASRLWNSYGRLGATRGGLACVAQQNTKQELLKLAGRIIALLECDLIPKSNTEESKVFYQMMLADY